MTTQNKDILFVRVYAMQDEAEEFAQVLREKKGREGVVVEGVVVVAVSPVVYPLKPSQTSLEALQGV